MSSSLSAIGLGLLLSTSILTVPASANLIQNGGFESRDLTGWTVNSSVSDNWRVEANAGVHSNPSFEGDYFVTTGCLTDTCINGNPMTEQNFLSQILSTDTNDFYTLSFEYTTNGFATVAPLQELTVLWDGTQVLDLKPVSSDPTNSGYTLFTVSGLTASTSSTTLTFLARSDAGFNGLDAISVVGAPEPVSFLLFGGALPLIWAARKRFRQ